jgi:hypothetical protein
VRRLWQHVVDDVANGFDDDDRCLDDRLEEYDHNPETRPGLGGHVTAGAQGRPRPGDLQDLGRRRGVAADDLSAFGLHRRRDARER